MKGLHVFGQRALVLFTILHLAIFASAIAPPFRRGHSVPSKRTPTADPATLLTNAARMQAGLTPLKPRSMLTPTRITGT
jgi:hypothetical protein